jgi:hypothetical protein
MPRKRAAIKPPPKAAFSVRYYEVTDWPEIQQGDELLVPRWVQTNINPEEGGPPHTLLRPAGLWRPTEFQKLDVEHERSKRSYSSPFYRQNWRVHDQVMNSVIERYTFTAYLPSHRRGIYMRANAMVAHGALKRIQESQATFDFRQRRVDVQQFIDCLQASVAKAWWRDMKLEHVSSASLAGLAVEQSPDYARFNEEGNLAAATLDIRWEGHLYQVMVSSLNTIFFFLSNEERATQLAAYVNELLLRCPGVVSSSTVRPPADDEDHGDDSSEPDASQGYDVQVEMYELDDGKVRPNQLHEAD